METTGFRRELQSLINDQSMENASNTPDWILADYLAACLDAFDRATQQRETWYGRESRPSAPTEPATLTEPHQP